MNKIFIIGNLVADPILRSTKDGIQVASFTLAVNNRKGAEGRNEATFFKITAWRGLAENCGKFLNKGRKVCVVGSVGVSSYKTAEGEARASLEVVADEVEFLSAADRQEEPAGTESGRPVNPPGSTIVDPEEMPF